MKKRFFLFGLAFIIAMQGDLQDLDQFWLTKINCSSYAGSMQTAGAGDIKGGKNKDERLETTPRTSLEKGKTTEERESIKKDLKRNLERILVDKTFGRGRSSNERDAETIKREKFFEAVGQFSGQPPPVDQKSLTDAFRNTPNKLTSENIRETLVRRAQYRPQTSIRNKVSDCQTVLGLLGYYDGKLDNIRGPKTRKAMQAFKMDIEQNSGILDTTTEATIEEWAFALQGTLSDIGFKDSQLSRAISSYARHLGLKEPLSGQELVKLREYIAFDLRLKNDLLDVVRSPSANDAILMYEKTDRGINAFFKRPDGRLEYCQVNEAGIKERKADSATLARLEQIGMDEVKTNSDEIISFVCMGFIRSESNESIEFQFGKEKVEIGQSEMKNLFTGMGQTPRLDKLFETKTLPKKMIIWRDYLSRGDENKEQFNYDHEYRMKIAEEMGYPSAERTELLIRLAEGLDRRYAGKCEILFDDDMKIGRDNANNLPSVRGPEDVAVYVPRAGWGVQDYRVIERIEDELSEADIKTVRGVIPVPMLNVIITIGHKDKAFRSSLLEFGAAGCLRNKNILLLSCHEKGDEAFISKLIKEFGAKAIQSPMDLINPQAVEEGLVSLSKIIKDRPASETNFFHLWRMAVDKAAEETNNPYVRRELEILRRGVPQVSFLERLRYFSNFRLCA